MRKQRPVANRKADMRPKKANGIVRKMPNGREKVKRNGWMQLAGLQRKKKGNLSIRVQLVGLQGRQDTCPSPDFNRFTLAF